VNLAARALPHVLVAAALALATPWPALGRPAPASAIHGVITTQQGAVRLPGVTVTIEDAATGRRAAQAVSDGRGTYVVTGLAAGRYRVAARLAGFSDAAPAAPVALAEGEDVEVNLDLPLAPVTEEVRVVGQAGLAQTETSVARDSVSGQMIDVLPVSGDGYRALLPVAPGVVRGADGRLTVKGARESQGALQVGRGYANDPSTGAFGIELPADSIDNVDILANPYTAEDGRFSSTVVRIETRTGTNDWHALLNGFVPVPCLTLCDGASWGIRYYRPRGWIGGPLVKDRLFLSQGAQYRFVKVRVPSLPESANDTSDDGLETFTRLDANLAPGHRMAASVAIFPRRTQFVGLNTFSPAEVSPSFRLHGYSGGVSLSSTLSPSLLAEASATVSAYDARVYGLGDVPQELTVEGGRGNYFNEQERWTDAVQGTGALTWARRGAAGEHVLRAGFDLMWASYRGTSRSRPVIVRRANGTVAERHEFGGGRSQQASGVDAAAFVQDRWRLSERLLFEPGFRLERDGVTDRVNPSPRLGVVVGVLGNDRGVVRGGLGRFYERTPLNVAAFRSFEPAAVTRFAADGITPAGAPLTFTHVAGRLDTPRSVIWNIEYDHRVTKRLFLKVNHMERRGASLAMLQPVERETGAELRLESRGRSRYAETELALRYGADDLQQLSVSYVRSRATGHLNAYDAYFGSFRNPIVRADEDALSPTDVPHRVIVRGTVTVREKWTLSTLLEMRSGFPYSIVDEAQQFVGPRNGGGRFPPLHTVDASILRAITVLGYPVRVGVRGYHLLNTFAPRDVQNNVDSPAFGTFYNSIPRRISFVFTFLPK
jgi:hypothetical protein